ncbi:MAG: HAMP domain-containing protein [Chloroflexi bacterium]|nr:HAMP domain-containing protein [Chloroflexota bacterium]
MKIRRLSVRLFLSYLVLLLVTVGVLWAGTLLSLPGAYGRQMHSSAPMMGGGMGPWQGGGQEADPASETGIPQYANIRSIVSEAFTYALLAALGVAVLLSLLVSRRLAAPLKAMTQASRRISEGRYNERVPAAGSDELGQMAESFNQMAGALEQVEAMRRQLIGDVTHELRTPLTTIKGSMEGLMDGVLPATADTYQQIHQEAGRLSRLVDDLQELSRVEARTYALDIRPLEVSRLVDSVVRRLSRSYEGKGVALTSSLPPGGLSILADEDRILQVLINLAGNALQYTPQGGRVEILAAGREQEVDISVRDNGIGIPPGHIGHIFTRFYRVDKSRSRQHGGGSGIGLTIARHLVEAQGGTIRAESAGEGQGSAFTVTLKRA